MRVAWTKAGGFLVQLYMRRGLDAFAANMEYERWRQAVLRAVLACWIERTRYKAKVRPRWRAMGQKQHVMPSALSVCVRSHMGDTLSG